MIYALVHPDTLEVRYVGKTRNVASRLKRHRGDSRRSELPVYRWWRKVVARDGHEPCLVRLSEGDSAEEIAMIAKLRADGARLLNCTDGGEGVSGFSRKRSPEEIARFVATRRERDNFKHTDEVRARLAGTSRVAWERDREKMVAAQRAGWTAEARAKIAASNKTPEKRAAFAAAKRSPVSAEHRAKISASLKGRAKPPRTEEHKARIGAASRGRVATPETRAKLRDAQRARRERERAAK